jgi:hypothetical protein
MKTSGTSSFSLLAGLALLASAGVTIADVSITFDVGAVGAQTAGRDTVSVAATPNNSVTESFTLGQPTEVPLQYLTWSTGSGGGNGGFFIVDLSRNFTATLTGTGSSAAGTITQNGMFSESSGKGATGDTLSVDGDYTTEITLGQYILDITPDGNGSSWSQKYGKSGTHELMASVTVTEVSPVPEVTTMLAGAGAVGLLALGVGVHSKRKVIRIGK